MLTCFHLGKSVKTDETSNLQVALQNPLRKIPYTQCVGVEPKAVFDFAEAAPTCGPRRMARPRGTALERFSASLWHPCRTRVPGSVESLEVGAAKSASVARRPPSKLS